MDPASLRNAVAKARAAYPGLTVPDAELVAHVVEKLALLGEGATLSMLRVEDLVLARAASTRDRVAILSFEQTTFGEIDAAYRRFPGIPVSLDDVKQRLREKLLLSQPAGILAYAGTGSLRGWVRAAALHLLINIMQRESREEPVDAELFEVVIGQEPSAEAAYVKLACRDELEAALAFAMKELSDRDRSLLLHAFVDRRSVDDIGAIYGVHRATAARWVAAARDRLVEHTRADLMRRLGISESDAKSIIAAALSGVGSMLIAKLVRS